MRSDLAELDRLRPLPPEDLPRQWVLSEDAGLAPEAWERRRGGGWVLAAHPDARVVEVRSREGAWRGWAIEATVVLRNGAPAPIGDGIALDCGGEPTPEELERALYGRWDGAAAQSASGLEGPWTVVLPSVGGKSGRVYVAAAHSIVYSPDRRLVATSANLVPELERDWGLSEALDPLARNGFYGFGLTAFRGLHRLLPNHYLDLATFEAHRQWPRRCWDDLESGREGAAALVEHGRLVLEALAAEHERFWISLSAGRDSRAVLAMTRALVESGRASVTLMTSFGSDVESRIDRQVAERLARIAGLPHVATRRPAHRSDAAQAKRMFVRIGEAYGGPILTTPRLAQGAVQDPEPRGFHLPGVGGEVGRARLWRRPDLRRRRTGPELVATRVGLPRVRPAVDAADRWLSGLPEGLRERAPDALGLAYVENCLGGIQAPGLYLFPGTVKALNLMMSARCIETMLRLPARYRLSGRVQPDMIAHAWPELLAPPFNRGSGRLGVEQVCWEARRLPRRVARRIWG